MYLFHALPSWDDIRRSIDRGMGFQQSVQSYTCTNGQQPSQALIFRRLNCVRASFDQAEGEASRILMLRFSDIDMSSIVTDLIKAVSQMAMVVVGGAVAGGVIGAGAGAIFGGVGAVPGGILGSTLGVQASTVILALLGLKSIADTVVKGVDIVIGHYLRGIKTAWEGPRDDGMNPFLRDDPYAQASAAHAIAQGHVEMVVLLLLAIVEYLTRGRGDARTLAYEMRASKSGERLGHWVIEHEDALKKRPELQMADPRSGGRDILGPEPSAPPVTIKAVDELSSRLIHEDPRNLVPTQIKSEMSGSQIKRIAKNMEKNGFDPLKPVDAWRNPNTGRLEIQDGHHRAAAAIRAGLDKIPVEVWE